jgi:hypothetical protein
MLGLLIAQSGLAQGYFFFRNISPGDGLDAPILDARGIPLEGTNYLAELYGGARPETIAPALDEVLRQRASAPLRTRGYFVGTGVLVLNVGGGDYAWLQVRAWDARLGATYEEVVARGLGGFGESPLFYALSAVHGHLSLPRPLIGLQSFRLRPATGVLMRGIRFEGDQVVVEWNPGFARYQLQQSSAVDHPWQNVGEPTTATSATNTIGGTTGFIRVIGLLE